VLFLGVMNRTSLYLLFPVLFWGLSYIAIKIVLDELSPVEMIAARFLLAAPVLYLIARLTNVPIWPLKKKLKLLAGAFVIFLHFWVMAVGMQETTASNTAWILTTAPFFIALLSWGYLKEKMSLSQFGGMVVACLGVLLLIYNGDSGNFAWINSRGDLIVLASCVTWAFYTIGAREITADVHPLAATFWMTAIAGAVFVPYTLLTSGVQRYLSLEYDTLISLVFLGIFCLAIAFWLWSEGLKRQPAAELGVWLYIEPLVTVVGAAIIINEPITFWLALGALLITLGVWISERFGGARPAEHDL
jgi:drug/metabolite transporter (DMT)-like permease